MNALSIITVVAAAVPPAESAGASAVEVNSLMDFVLKGGPIMVPIGICSAVALAVIVERLISLRRSLVIPPAFVKGVREVLRGGDRRAALEYCRSHPSPVANVFAAGIKRLGAPIEVVEKHIQEAGEREVLKLRRFLRVLSVIAAVSPLLGLLGTIFGMITAFQTVALSAEALGKAELLAEGIYEAMITTAAGLSVAIPVLIFYHLISAKVEKLVMEIDQLTVDFLEEHAFGAPADEPIQPIAPAAAAAGRSNTKPVPPGPDVQVAPT